MVHTFAYKNRYFALDVESGSLHVTDEAAYERIRTLAKADGRGGGAASLLSEDELDCEIRELIRGGLLFAPEGEDARGTQSVIKAACLHLAHDCNLRCDYCFAKCGAFEGKRELMSEDTARKAIDFIIEASGKRRNLEVDFFGGEPLLNFEVLKETVDYARSVEKERGKNIRFTVTTNGYHLTGGMKEYLNANMHNIVVSIDGRPHVHDAVRKTPEGNGSYERVARNAKELLLGREGEYYVRGTFTADNLDFSKDALHLADMGFKGVSLEPVVTKGKRAILPEHLGTVFAEYEKLAEEYAKRRREGRGFAFFHFMVDLTGGPCVKKRVRGCGAGTEYIAVAPSGGIYPCHQFVGKPEYLMGSVHGGGLDAGIAETFEKCDIYNIESCRGCWAKYYCSAGCAAANLNMNGDIMKPYETGCEMQKKRLEIALAIAAEEMEDI